MSKTPQVFPDPIKNIFLRRLEFEVSVRRKYRDAVIVPTIKHILRLSPLVHVTYGNLKPLSVYQIYAKTLKADPDFRRRVFAINVHSDAMAEAYGNRKTEREIAQSDLEKYVSKTMREIAQIKVPVHPFPMDNRNWWTKFTDWLLRRG